MLVWINGTFGVGKTQTAHELARKIPGAVVADPELLGFGIQRMYPPPLRRDFQETPWWTPIVSEILVDLCARHDGTVIVPMALSDEVRFNRIFGALDDAGIQTRHFALLGTSNTVRARLRSRAERWNGWAGTQFDDVDRSLRREMFATHVHTDGMSLTEVVASVGSDLGLPISYSMAERALLLARVQVVKARHIR